MKPISYMEMAIAVTRCADEAERIIRAIDAGEVIGPSDRDIRAGATDVRRQAELLIAASTELLSLARLQTGNDRERIRRVV